MLVLAALCLVAWQVRAASPDDEYLEIYNTIGEADALLAKGDTNAAIAKYRGAADALRSFQRAHADWHPQTVAFRLNYAAAKVVALTAPPPLPPRSDNSTPSASTSQSQGSAGISSREFKLLEPGAEPRSTLRLHPKPDDKQSVLVTVKMTVENQMGGMGGQALKLPAITLPMDVSIKNVSPDGEITYEMVMGEAGIVDEPGAMPQMAEVIKASLAGVKGLTGTGIISARGISKGVEFKAPPGADPQTRQLMDQLKSSFADFAIPFPEEPVGAGAKWEVAMPLKSQGINLRQTANYQLVSVEGDQIAVKCALKQDASKQKIENPAMGGLKMDLTKMVGTGSADTKVDLGQLMPREATMASRSELSMTMNAGGQSQSMTAKIGTDVRFESK